MVDGAVGVLAQPSLTYRQSWLCGGTMGVAPGDNLVTLATRLLESSVCKASFYCVVKRHLLDRSSPSRLVIGSIAG